MIPQQRDRASEKEWTPVSLAVRSGLRPKETLRARLPAPHSFSIIELMVAMTVLSILVFILLSMLGSLTTIWQQGQAHNERRTTAQAVLERMTRDISQAELSPSSNPNSLFFAINPTWITAATNSIFFQAPVATDGGTNGNLAVVGYYVKWVGPGTPGTPTLMRILINPTDSNYKVYSVNATYSGNATNTISDALLGNAAYTGATAPTYNGLLADNVLGVWMQALDLNGNPISQTSQGLPAGAFDSRYQYTYTGLRDSGSQYLTTNVPSAMPASVQIAVAVVDSRTAKRLTAIPGKYKSSGNLWSDVQNFYTNLPAAVLKGTEIQTTIVPCANSPR